MKETIENQIDTIFAALLFSLPQGVLFGVVLVVYAGWGMLSSLHFRIPSVLAHLHSKSAV